MRKIKEYWMRRIERHALLRESLRVIRGRRCYDRLRKALPKGTKIILVRGATGDVYIQLSMLRAYAEKNHLTQYAIVGDVGCLRALAEMFRVSNVTTIPFEDCLCVLMAYRFFPDMGENVQIPFFWDYGWYFNRCRVRMTEPFDFMDTYRWCSFSMEEPIVYTKPQFTKKTENFLFRCDSAGIIAGKTVFISPEANSVTRLPIWFWNGIIKELQALGYTVFVNSNEDNFYRAPNLFPPYSDSVPMLEQAGYFIGVRSGFCDIISSAKCKKIILYPQVQPQIDYSEHRSEIEFSSLVTMGLCDGKDLKEISTPLLRNITDKDWALAGLEDYYAAIEVLHEKIMNEFKR
jgi:hypothetical protein